MNAPLIPPLQSLRWPIAAAIVLCAFASSSPTGAGAASNSSGWRLIGPGVHDVVAVAIAPGAPNVEYASIRAGGTYRSEDGGKIWTLAAQGLPAQPAPIWLGVDPARPATAIALAGGLPFRTTDAGRHWRLRAAGLPAGAGLDAALISPWQPSIVFTGGTRGVFRSADGGAS